MKFNKSFLFAAVMAGSVVLTACNDKESKPAESQPQTTQPAPAALAEPAQPQQAPMDPALEQAAKAFQQVVKVDITNVNIPEDMKSLGVTYAINNLSDKAISSLQWLTVYKSDNRPFYVANLPGLQFEKTIAPKATESVTLTTSEEAVLSQIRPYIKPGANIQIDTIGLMVNFADGSHVGLQPTPAQPAAAQQPTATQQPAAQPKK